MIFENGDHVMTYQSSKVLTDEEKESLMTYFNSIKTDEIYDCVITKSTVNVLYQPTLMMERLSIVDPSNIVLEKMKKLVEVIQ